MWGTRLAGSNVVMSLEDDVPLICSPNKVGEEVSLPVGMGGGVYIIRTVKPARCPSDFTHRGMMMVFTGTNVVVVECDRCKRFHWYRS